MRAGQIGQRQVEQSGVILKDHAVTFLMGMPVLAVGEQWRPELRAPGLDHLQRCLLLRADDTGHTLADGFSLVGLGQWADAMINAQRVLQFG